MSTQFSRVLHTERLLAALADRKVKGVLGNLLGGVRFFNGLSVELARDIFAFRFGFVLRGDLGLGKSEVQIQVRR